MKQDWDKIFCEAASLSIQNVNPAPSLGSRNIFKEDKNEIINAAKKYGFKIVGDEKDKVVAFVRYKRTPSSPNDQKLSHAAGDSRQPETRSENCQA